MATNLKEKRQKCFDFSIIQLLFCVRREMRNAMNEFEFSFAKRRMAETLWGNSRTTTSFFLVRKLMGKKSGKNSHIRRDVALFCLTREQFFV